MPKLILWHSIIDTEEEKTNHLILKIRDDIRIIRQKNNYTRLLISLQ